MTELRQRMLEELQRRNYSKETIRLYLFAVKDFARHFKKRPDLLRQEHMREFQLHLLNERKLAVETVAARITALRFFFVKVLHRPYRQLDLIYPKLPMRLPTVLSEDEVAKLIKSASSAYPRRLTFSGNNRSPVWSPDSMWVAFQSDRDGDLAIFRQRADGSGTAERLTKPDADTSHFPDSWSPDGNTLLFEVRKVGSPAFLWAMAMSRRDKKVTQFGNIQNANPIDAVFSPTGRWVAYNSGETGKNEVFVQPFPATRAQYQIPKSADNHAPIWSPDETELFYVAGPGQFAAVRITVQPSFDIGNAVAVFNGSSRGTNPPSISRNFDIMPDGKHILAVVAASQDQTGATFGPQIQVILNWFDDLKRRIEVNH